MIGSVAAGALKTVVAVVLPGVACAGALGNDQTPPDDLRKWCRYWVALAACTAVELPVVSMATPWLPLHQEVRVAFALWLALGGSETVYARLLAIGESVDDTVRSILARAVRMQREMKRNNTI